MVSEEKIRIMTKLAQDESELYKAEIREAKYFRGDFIRNCCMKFLSGYTASYILVLVLLALYYVDNLIIHVSEINFQKLGLIILGIYLGVFLLILMISIRVYARQYDQGRRKLREYKFDLSRLQKYYKDSQEGGV